MGVNLKEMSEADLEFGGKVSVGIYIAFTLVTVFLIGWLFYISPGSGLIGVLAWFTTMTVRNAGDSILEVSDELKRRKRGENASP